MISVESILERARDIPYEPDRRKYLVVMARKRLAIQHLHGAIAILSREFPDEQTRSLEDAISELSFVLGRLQVALGAWRGETLEVTEP